MIGTFDLEKRVAELERRLDEGEDMNHADRIEKLERAHDDLWDKVVTPYRQRLDALEARKPAPEPVSADVQCEINSNHASRLYVIEKKLGVEHSHPFMDQRIAELKDMAIVRHVTPAQIEAGRGLVRQCEYANHPADFPLFDMRDWIASVCGEG